MELLYKSEDQITPYTSSRGAEFIQLFQRFPALEYLYTPFEKNFQAKTTVEFAQQTFWIPTLLIALYLVGIFGGKAIMKDRKPFGIKNELAAWNLFLSVFSFCGMFRTVPHLLHMLATKPFQDTICQASEVNYGEGATGFWVMLFIFSKVPELIDTVFIVLRKKPLIFLHWYHHITVLAFCWHSYATESSTGIYFVAMNYSVHAVMYGYYFLMATGNKPKWLPPMAITMAQISQMFIGVSVCIASYIYKRSGVECSVKEENIIAGALMYGSYFYLFAEFAVKRFILAPKKAKKNL
jgi:hypothetical protein